MKKYVSILLVALLVTFAMIGCAPAASAPAAPAASAAPAAPAPEADGEAVPEKSQDTVVITFNMPPNNGAPPYDCAVNYLAPETLARTNGRYTFEVYGSSSLSGNDMISGMEMVQAGAIGCMILTGITFSNVVYETASLSLPFMWNDMETVYKTLNIGTPVADRLNTILEENGFELLGFPAIGFRDITNSKQTVRKPEDLKGLKMRVQSNDMVQELWKGFGANTTYVDNSELYTALQNGTIDGQENALVLNNIPMKIYEVNKKYTQINITEDPFIMVMNLDKWNSIPAEDQAILREVVAGYVQETRNVNDALYDEDVQLMKDNGVEITALTDEEVQVWRDASVEVTQKYAAKLDQELIGLVYEANGRTYTPAS